LLDDRPGPQEPDTGYDLSRDPGGIGGDTNTLSFEHFEAVGADEGEERRAESHEDVGPESGGLIEILTFEADQATEEGRQADTYENVEVIDRSFLPPWPAPP
jgi:hypothetical protein